MKKYDPKKLEKKWQSKWEKAGVYGAKDNSRKDKYYCLVEFPYPSGDGLHVGHVRSYTAMDIIARKRRMEGKNVLYPIGWDAFGLPTENYAVKTGIHPKKVTKLNTDNFRRQLKAMGFSFDWEREVNTSDPNYYKWTQWIFLKLFKHGLAYKAKTNINWCPSCKIGLANEEVVAGNCERCGAEVVQKEKEQWMLKITAYADKLLAGLKDVDYLEEIKTQQQNWIGRSEGAEVEFRIKKQEAGKSNFVLLHGYKGSPKKDFFPWLKKEIESKGYEVYAPQLPDPAKPNIYKQTEFLLKNYKFNEDTVVITHSLGGVDAMKLLPKIPKKIGTLIMVAPPKKIKFLDGKKRPALEDACDWKFDWKSIKTKADNIIVVADEGDDIVPLSQPEEIANKLGAKFIKVKARNSHFNSAEEPAILKILSRFLGDASNLNPNPYTLDPISVFTTRPDTLFGATYLVLAPEHEALANNELGVINYGEVKKYIARAKKKTQEERMVTKAKTGIRLEGIVAVNPVNGEELPIWVADYVLGGYGTGAIMAVPAHDERDMAFAKEHDLSIKTVIEPMTGEPQKNPEFRRSIVALVKNPKTGKFLSINWGSKMGGNLFIGGGLEDGEDATECAKREIEEETGYQNVRLLDISEKVHHRYFASSKNVARQIEAVGLYFELENEKKAPVKHEKDEAGKFTVEWLSEEEAGERVEDELHRYVFEKFVKGLAYAGEGIAVNSGILNGLSTPEAKEKIIAWLEKNGYGRGKVQYKLRDWVFSRQRYWGEPIPLVYCDSCATGESSKNAKLSDGEKLNPGWIPVEDKDLPVELPNIADFKPRDDGESPLASAISWTSAKCPRCGGKGRRETDVMPNWAGSSWYFLRYTDPGNARVLASPKKLKYWMPVDWYNGGMEHVTLHLLYSRFWNLFLNDIGVVPEKEPYNKRTAHGMVLGEGGIKMSKSKGNVVNPDDMISAFGSDALRLYEMFMGPFDQAIPWDPQGIVGTARFLEKVWRVAHGEAVSNKDNPDLERLAEKTVKAVSEDIEDMAFNTVISKLMIFINNCQRAEIVPLKAWKKFLLLLAPFAPHMAEELWHSLPDKSGGKKFNSVHTESWPEYDESMTKDDTVSIGVQVNGKTRGVIELAPDAPEAEALKLAMEEKSVKKNVEGSDIRKVIYVPGRILNIIV